MNKPVDENRVNGEKKRHLELRKNKEEKVTHFAKYFVGPCNQVQNKRPHTAMVI